MRRQQRRRQEQEPAPPPGPPAFPLDTLPAWLRDMVEAVAAAHRVDVGVTALAAMWVVDQALRGKVSTPGMATDAETDALYAPLVARAIERGLFTKAAFDDLRLPPLDLLEKGPE